MTNVPDTGGADPAEDPRRGVDDDDWRLTGQESYLQHAIWVRKRYRAPSETWDHDHCEFCWAKFMDPDHSPADRAFMDENPDVLSEGYASVEGHPRGADYHWVCDTCFGDFSARFGWKVGAEPAGSHTSDGGS